ncbi:transcriptional regulator GlxA family with amidase domain [Streptosporangium becharense]|uniref:Transcriptional regulator GlxA family with amidase domain n=1 Tax=Streptosporangium becharense TaxID=1816182 RepID=A0A7W9IIJ2_9ACTN|nr:helix-turn-helix domain-containing protein [Streptosporangium becharense]MBB2913952.1 transcriptional regulator GlxA family with amidase domain [Streptosporangium becharense]MBB5821387.1 transcriptional regulator GlxA family with amidase domain [Streptosporangium becharense]
MLRNVAVLALDGGHAFELGVFCEIFGIDRGDDGLPVYDFAVVSPTGETSVPTRHGFHVQTPHGLERLEAADLIGVPAADPDKRYPEELFAALRAAAERGARVLSICSGAFLLGEAGLLDGRRCTTHWRYGTELARRYPRAQVELDVLYVDEDPVITGAGTAAGIDTCLHLVRKEQGSTVANDIARRMVAPPYRDGGQTQYIKRPEREPGAGPLASLLTWLQANLHEELSVEGMARQAHMSPRTFARRFQREVGTTPLQWLTDQRVQLAQRHLENTDEPVAVIAERSGFGSVATLRHHFTRRLGTTPHTYRRTFRGRHAGSGQGRMFR